MSALNIFVEGKTDRDFMEALWKFHFKGVKLPRFIILDGDQSRISEHSDRLNEGKVNLIILDSDVNTQSEVENILNPIIEKERLAGREFNYACFFIERNLEELVRSIAPKGKSSLWSCIDNYANCNSVLGDPGLRKVDNKSKVYIYVNAHEGFDFKTNAYSDEIWDLNHENLNPLVNFLKQSLES